jgi:predicted DNA-binding protein
MEALNSKLTVKIPYDLKKRFKALCVATDTEMSDEIRRFIEKRLEEKGKVKAKA